MMKKQHMLLTRQELYQEVWKTPMRTLAAQFGLSDRGLAKICKRHDIPCPGRGYWAKLQYGRRVPARPPLSKKRPLDEEILMTGYIGKSPNIVKPTRLLDYIDSVPPLMVPGILAEPHPLVDKTAKILRSARKSQDIIKPRKNSHLLNIHVSHDSLERALRVMDTVVNALEHIGASIKVSKNPLTTSTKIYGEQLEFQLKEELDKVPHTPTKTEVRDKEQYPWRDIPSHDAVPSGRLTLSITNLPVSGIRRNWSDGKRKLLEDRLEGFLVGLFRASEAIKADREEKERRDREWEAERQRQEEARRWRLLEEKRIEMFQNDVTNWRQAQDYWAFIHQVETLASNSQTGIPKAVQDWLKWATQKVESLDPLYKNLPTLLSMDEFLEDNPYILYS